MPEPSYHTLLIVEDSDEDFEALRRLISRVANLTVSLVRCVDGEDALDFLYSKGQYAHLKTPKPPGLIVLDLNLPGTDGREVLRQIKQDQRLKVIPVVVMTTSSNPKDIETCYRYGANTYTLKPINIKQLKDSVQSIIDYWFRIAILPDTL